jgi:hypothetical protein
MGKQRLAHSAAELDTAVNLVNTHTKNADIHVTATEKSDFSALQTRVGTAETSLSSLQTQVESNVENLSALQSTIETDESNISSLKERVDTNETNISAIQTQIATDEKTYYRLASWESSIAADSDLNTYTAGGIYRVTSASTSAKIANTPTSVNGYKLIVEKTVTDNRVRQTAITTIGVVYQRFGLLTDNTWTDWERLITSTEFDALSARVTALEGNA